MDKVIVCAEPVAEPTEPTVPDVPDEVIATELLASAVNVRSGVASGCEDNDNEPIDGAVLSTTNGEPLVGVAVTALPATSTAIDITTAALPSPLPTV